MDMHILSVNVGRPQIIAGHKAPTGIVKRPVAGPVDVGAYGLRGDAIMDTKNHGGLDQAVYLYGEPDYAHFEAALGRRLEHGLFGENLTVSGLESATINIGDRLAIGDVVLEITSPRNPCATFAARMGDPHWVKYFLAAGRLGLYGRVLAPGAVAPGMAVTLSRFAGAKIPVNELSRDYKNPSPERMRYLLQAPIHRELAVLYETRLAQGDLLA